MAPNFNMENLWIDKKPRAYNRSKTSTMKNKKLNTRFYLTQVHWSFPDHLTSTFLLPASHLLFQEHTWSPHQLDLNFFLNPHKKKMGFYPDLIVSILRDEWRKESPIFFSRKSIENNLENNRKIWFLSNRTPQTRKRKEN